MKVDAEWPLVRLGDVITASYGKALPAAKRKGGSVPVYGSNGVVGQHDAAITTGPTIVIGRKGSSGAINFSPVSCWPIDTTYFVDDPGPYSLAFLERLLRSLRLEELDRSTAIPGLSREQLYDIKVPLPQPEEQARIVTQLSGTEHRRVAADTHLASARRAIERFRTAVLVAACSGRLTADWREQRKSEPVMAAPVLSRQGLANASRSSNTNDLVEIPDTWAWWPVESITDLVIDYRGRTPPSEATGPIPHVRTTQIRNGRIDWDTDRFVTQPVYDQYMTRGLPKRGDVLFTMEAPLGEVGVVDRDEPFSIAQRILLMRPGNELSGNFLALTLESHPVRRAIEHRATGSGVLGIAYKRLRSVVLPKPPIAEQLEIVRHTEALLSLADGVSRRLDSADGRLSRLSQAELAKAFRGDLVVGGTGVAG